MVFTAPHIMPPYIPRRAAPDWKRWIITPATQVGLIAAIPGRPLRVSTCLGVPRTWVAVTRRASLVLVVRRAAVPAAIVMLRRGMTVYDTAELGASYSGVGGGSAETHVNDWKIYLVMRGGHVVVVVEEVRD